MAELGGGFQVFGGGVGVARDPLSAEEQHGKREGRGRVPALGREPEPVRRLLVVLRDAIAVGVKLTQQRHRFRVGIVAGKPRRLGESRDIKPALVGAEGAIQRGVRRRRRRRRSERRRGRGPDLVICRRAGWRRVG